MIGKGGNIVSLKTLLFGYKENTEYWIPIKDIIITYNFQLTSPYYGKFKSKENKFLKSGTLGKIILNNKFELVDGYCSYLICKKHALGKVPVYFVN